MCVSILLVVSFGWHYFIYFLANMMIIFMSAVVSATRTGFFKRFGEKLSGCKTTSGYDISVIKSHNKFYLLFRFGCFATENQHSTEHIFIKSSLN